MDEQLLMELKRKLSLYRYCLDEWAQHQTELGSMLKYQADAEELLHHLLAEGSEVAEFRSRLRQLNLEKMRIVDGHPMYVPKLREELDADLHSVEVYMDILHRLEYEEALHLWISLEAAGHILTELERVDGQATHQTEWARYEALRRELVRRLEELPEDTEVVHIRPEGLSAPLPQKAVAEGGEPYTVEEANNLKTKG
jgi:hypothetical protein